MRWEAILLAAGKPGREFSEFSHLPSKAYIPILGKRMADSPLQALQSISALRRVVAVIPEGAPGFANTVGVTGGTTIVQSLAAGFESLLPGTEMALVVACDLPCLSRDSVEDFMRQSEIAGAGLCYGYVSRRDSEEKFPGIPHTYVRTPEGEFCGGGLSGIVPGCFPMLRSLAERGTRDRKNIFKLAAILGSSFIMKFLTKRLSIQDIERRLTELLGFPAKGILSRFPEVAFNVDDSKALALAQMFLEKNK